MMDQEKKQIEKMFEQKADLTNVVDYATRDYENYLDECHSEEIPPIESVEDFIADAVLSAGYRKQIEGEWKEVYDGVSIGEGKHLECSECGVWKKDRQRSNFCPHCGSKMKGGDTDA